MKKLACRLGRHEWTTRVEGGESYKVCAACGKSPRELEHQHPGQREQQPHDPGPPGGDVGAGGGGDG